MKQLLIVAALMGVYSISPAQTRTLDLLASVDLYNSTNEPHAFAQDDNGVGPFVQLKQASDGRLFDYTQSTGAYDRGNIFSLNPDRADFTVVEHFSDSTAEVQFIYFPPVAELRYGMAPVAANATASSTLPVTLVSSDTTVVKVNGDNLIVRGLGTATITASQAGNYDYLPAADSSQIVNVLPGYQVITFDTLRTYYLGEDKFILNASTNSGLLLNITISDTTIAKIDGGLIVLKSRGVTTITVEQPGNEFWEPASPVSQTLKVEFLSEMERIWGTLSQGGPGGGGSAYSACTDGSIFVNNVNFERSPSGPAAGNGLIQASNGLLYGVTANGGRHGNGTIFTVSTSGAGYRVLHAFEQSSGVFPYGSLMQAPDGKLYGTTRSGGPGNRGVIFRMELDGSNYQVIHYFTGPEGADPYTGLVDGQDGYMYGTTLSGGAFGYGTLFRMAYGSTDLNVILHSNFNSVVGNIMTRPVVKDGYVYYMSRDYAVTGTNTVTCNCQEICNFFGCFYFNCQTCTGTTYTHVGLLNRVATDGSNFTNIHIQHDMQPGSEVVVNDGTIYGRFHSTLDNNASFIFKYDESTGFTPILGGQPGSNAYQSIQFDGGLLYSIQDAKGTNGVGYFGSVNTDGTNPITLYNFESQPVGLVRAGNGDFFMMTRQGGLGNNGRIYRYSTATSQMSVLVDLDKGLGEIPGVSLQASDGNIYGVTTIGGSQNRGIIYRTSPEGIDFTKLLDLPVNFGDISAIVEGSDGYLYFSSRNNNGSIFKIRKDGSGFTTILTLNPSVTGGDPSSIAFGPDGYLYGTAQSGGGGNGGTLFRLLPDGTNFEKLYDFGSSSGMYPSICVPAPDGRIYGITRFNGPGGYGTMFRFRSDEGLSVLHSFDATQNYPRKIVLASDSLIYGATEPGPANRGVVYKIRTDGSDFSVVYQIPNSAAGENPTDLQFKDNSIYLQNGYGGSTNGGNLVKVSSDGSSVQVLKDFSTASGIYPHHFSNLLVVGPRADQSIIFDNIPPKNASDSTFLLTATASSGLPVTFTSNDPSIISVDGNAASILSVGTVTLTATQVGTKSYRSVEASQTLTIEKADQTITFAALAPKTVSDPPFMLTATASSGLVVSYSSSDPTIAEIHGDTVVINNEGEVTITASQPGDARYNAATPVLQVLTITDPVLRPTVAAASITFPATYSTQLRVSFAVGNGARHLVVARHASAVTWLPQDDVIYPASNNFASGVDLGDGSRVISNDTTNTVYVTGLLPSTQYHFTVYEYNTDGTTTKYLTTGSPAANKTTLALPAVYVLTPANNATGINVTVNVTSRALTGASTYTIQVSPAASFSSGVIENSGARTQSFTGLSYSTPYYTRVKTDLSPDFGTTTTFTTGSPESFSYVTSPANNAVNVLLSNLALNVTANNVIGGLLYTIELNTNGTFTGTSHTKTGGRTLNFTGLSPSTTYYTRVKTQLSPNWGPTRQFTTAPPSAMSYVVTPANNATNVLYMPAVTVNDVQASSYTVQLSPFTDFSSGVVEIISPTKTMTFPVLLFDTNYYSRVSTNLDPTWGPTRAFTTNNPLSRTYVSSPADSAVNVNYSTNITANTVPGATLYTIEANTASDFSGESVTHSNSNRTMAFVLRANTIYYVRAQTDLLPGQWGVSRTFTTRNPLASTYITSPANNAVNVSTIANVTANSILLATNYTIELDTNSAFTGTSLVMSGPVRTYTFNLQPNTIYFARVQTDIMPGEWGPTRSFTTVNTANSTYMITPTDGATNVSYITNITASNVAGATTYTIEANTASDFTGTSTVMTGLGRTFAFSLGYNTLYYVRAQTNLMPGSWGPTRTFTTNDPPTYSYITAPADGATNVNYVTNVTSYAVPGAGSYIIEANTAADFTGASVVKMGTARTYSFSLLHNTVYYVRVQTNLVPGAWGPVRSFTTGSPQSLAYVTNPLDGGTGVPTTVNVTSNQVSGASSYTIELNTSISFSNTPLVISGAGRTKAFAGLAEGTTYYSRVSTNLTPGLWGPIRSFTTLSTTGRMAGGKPWQGDDTGEDVILDEELSVDVYPNPFVDDLQVMVQTASQQPLAATLYDMQGKALFESTGWSTNRLERINGQFPEGVYLLRLKTGETTKVVKVIRR